MAVSVSDRFWCGRSTHGTKALKNWYADERGLVFNSHHSLIINGPNPLKIWLIYISFVDFVCNFYFYMCVVWHYFRASGWVNAWIALLHFGLTVLNFTQAV